MVLNNSNDSSHINLPSQFRSTNTLKPTRQNWNPPKVGTAFGLFPTFRRPNTNGVNANINPHDYTSPFGKARPMKHWRKQLHSEIKLNDGTSYKSGKSDALYAYSEQPGGKIYTEESCLCTGEEAEDEIEPLFNVQETYPNQNVKIQNNGYVQVGDPESPDSYQIPTGIYNTKCLSGSPESKIIKPASTIISKSYYSDTKGYLQARCRNYQQKASINPISTELSKDGVYQTNLCPQSYRGCKTNTTIYKPSNQKFAVQGSVPSSLRVRQKQVETITNNYASFNTAYGLQGTNSGRYTENGTSPYFTKSKQNVSTCERKNGGKTKCFK